MKDPIVRIADAIEWIMVFLFVIMIAQIAHCQCIDTQYVAPSGKVMRVTNNCIPPDDCYNHLYPSGFVLDSMYTAADARYWAKRCRTEFVTVTLTKGCPVCGSMERVQYPGETARLEWFDKYSIVSRLSEVSVCRDCGTVYRGRR
jgi:hypothetical protein